MSQFQLYLYIWFSLMMLSVVASWFIKRFQGKKAASPEDFMLASFALGGAITLFRVLLRALTQESLQAELEWDGTIALCISATLGIYLSLEEFKKLLF